MAQRLTDMDITRVSAVDKGAAGRWFAIFKRLTGGGDVAKALLPIGERDAAWDASAAEGRVRAWAGGDSIDWGKYAKAFLWHDSANAEQFGSYKLGFADVVDGKLTAIPRGLFACAGVMQGARGGVDIPEADRDGVKSRIASYYSAMTRKFDDDAIVVPWDVSKKEDHMAERVSKTQTFASIIAGQELSAALDDSFWVLRDALWSAIYATDATFADLSLEAKSALVATDLDEFKAYLLAAMERGITKRAGGDAELVSGAIASAVAKVGRKVSAARLERLQAAAEALNSVLAEVLSEEEIEKRASAQEVEMTSEELAKALEPITGRLDAIEKRLPPEKPAAAGDPVKKDGEAEDELTLEGVATAVLEIRTDLDAITKARGERTSADGQEAGGEPVKKSRWAGIF